MVLLLAGILLTRPGAARAATDSQPPAIHPETEIVIAAGPVLGGTPQLHDQFLSAVRRTLEEAHLLKGRLRIKAVAAPEQPSASLPSEGLLKAARDATFLLWGRAMEDGTVQLYLVHMYALSTGYQSRQAAGSRPVVPILHRLPDFHVKRPLKAVYALLGISYLRQGNFRAAAQTLASVNNFPDLSGAERYPVVFFMAVAELLSGLGADQADQVDRALYNLGTLWTVRERIGNPHLVGAALVNRALALQLRPGRRGPAQLKEAIRTFEAALPFYRASHTPLIHARIMHQIATAEQRLPPERDGYHLHRAILAYKKALRIWGPEVHPEAYRDALHNMALCYQRLPTGDRTRNLLTAIRLYRQAVALPALAHRPALSAITYGNLGQAYQLLPADPSGANLRQAIGAYREALRYWQLAENRPQLQRLHQLAGMAYQELPTGDVRENLLQAAGHFESALAVSNREADPMTWALIQLKLGVVFARLPPPGTRHALTRARDAFLAALEIITPDNLPYFHAKVVKNLEQVENRLDRLNGEGEPADKKLPRGGNGEGPDGT